MRWLPCFVSAFFSALTIGISVITFKGTFRMAVSVALSVFSFYCVAMTITGMAVNKLTGDKE